LTGPDIPIVDPDGFALPDRRSGAGRTAMLLQGVGWDGRLWDPDVALSDGRWRMVMPEMQAQGLSGCPATSLSIGDPAAPMALGQDALHRSFDAGGDRDLCAAIHAVSGLPERAIGAGRDSFVAVGDRRREVA
jgi:hypothetical protein